MRCNKLILLTGGIGVGKSVVSRILRLNGYDVFDTDIIARGIMDNDEEMCILLTERWGSGVYTDKGILNRRMVAEIIFGNDDERKWLNAKVHGKVRDELTRLCRESLTTPAFVECAIPTTSLIDRMVDRIWLVTAPETLRIARATQRDNSNVEAIKARIEAQKHEFDSLDTHRTSVIVNDDTPLLPQIQRLLNEIK